MKHVSLTISIVFLLASVTFASSLLSEETNKLLSKTIVEQVSEELATAPTEDQRAFIYFTLAVETADPSARDKAEEYYAHLGTPVGNAYLGAIETLKARDFAGGGALKTILSFTPVGFARLYHAYKGADLMDKAVEDDPENINIRLVRSWTYYNVPAFMEKKLTGKEDVEKALQLMGNRPAPEEYRLGNDPASAYYLAGLYYANLDMEKEAEKMFLKTLEANEASPYRKVATTILSSIERK